MTSFQATATATRRYRWPSTGWSWRAQLFHLCETDYVLSIWCVRSTRRKLLFSFICWFKNHRKWFGLRKMHGATHRPDTQCALFATLASWFWFAVNFLLHLFDLNTMKEGTQQRIISITLWSRWNLWTKIDCLPHSFMASRMNSSVPVNGKNLVWCVSLKLVIIRISRWWPSISQSYYSNWNIIIASS